MPRQLEDRQGRNVVMLVESIRDSMPVNAALVSRRMALEQVSGLLSGACQTSWPLPGFQLAGTLNPAHPAWMAMLISAALVGRRMARQQLSGLLSGAPLLSHVTPGPLALACLDITADLAGVEGQQCPMAQSRLWYHMRTRRGGGRS